MVLLVVVGDDVYSPITILNACVCVYVSGECMPSDACAPRRLYHYE